MKTNHFFGHWTGAALARARTLILEAETSCFLFWGDAWIPHLHERTVPAQQALEEAERQLESDSARDKGAGDV